MLRLRLPLAVAGITTAGALAASCLAAGGATVSASPASPSAPTVTWSDPAPVIGGTATTTTTALYRFSTLIGGKPVRWNPCAAVHWRFRTAGAPTGSGTIVKAAVARISRATGITFVYDGTTTATPTSAWLPKTTLGIRPLLIGWTDASHSDLLRNQAASVLGVTRTAYFGITLDGVQLAATKAAVIALDRTNRLPLTGSVSWSTTLQHELAHAMGLAHVSNSKQLMYPVLQRTLYGLQSGDLAGLYKLGRSAGCINLGF
ncbi:MAG TPA: matrixin family metalloprotease [Mycobacteriales bacterium]|nr:matrixin family metalloprotease [Mycobacteriales bacterium]